MQMYHRFPGTEEPAEHDGVVNYFMESLPRIDPFAYLQRSRLRVLMNRRLLRDWLLEDPDDIPDHPTEPLGAWQTIQFVGELRLEPGGFSFRIFPHPLSTPDVPCGSDEF